ncbi:hypothetical protein VDGD_21111 [Verticillium dahliae]|nr:hypothetical protein VDGD_21111 [Verticillium dahliae]
MLQRIVDAAVSLAFEAVATAARAQVAIERGQVGLGVLVELHIRNDRRLRLRPRPRPRHSGQ